MNGDAAGRPGRLGTVLVFGLLFGPIACGSGDAEPAERASAGTAAEAALEMAPAGTISVAGVGFETPESVLHDAAADVYLVSNIRGAPSDKDNNGFISRLSPDGEVRALHWIEGGRDGVVLRAPKGMAIKGDSLFVADIDTVRIFHRESGAPLGGLAVPGAEFLNDLAVGPDGVLYVTDTGVRITAQGMEARGTDAVYRFGAGGAVETLARGPDLQGPNGLAAGPDGVVMVPFGTNEIYRFDAAGQRTRIAQLPAGQFDGVVRLDDGSLLVSSWEGQAVYHVDAEGEVTPVVEGIESPADIGYDAARGRILIPVFMGNRVEIRPLSLP